MNFADFWQAYPRRVGRKQAERKWAQMSAADQQFCMASLAQWKQTQQWHQADGAYIPYGSTFLAQERWRDEAWRDSHSELKLTA